MNIAWINKVSGEKGYVGKVHWKERYFESDKYRERKEYPNLGLANYDVKFLKEICPDNDYVVE
jgi:hypothetical protein